MSESTFDDHWRRNDDDTDREPEPEAWLFYLDPENIRRLKLPADTVETARLLYCQERQMEFLRGNRFQWFNRPDGVQSSHGLRRFHQELAKQIRSWEQAAVIIGQLPKSEGETTSYRHGIRMTIRTLAQQLPVPKPFVIPFEVEVAVAPDLTGRLPKDLDNILLDLVGVIREELVDEHRAYLAGYRAYVEDPGLSPPRSVRLRLLPPRSIYSFYSESSDRIDSAIEWIEKDI